MFTVRAEGDRNKSPTMKWTREEVFFLMLNHNQIPVADIAERLGKTKNAVWKKAHRLRLAGARLRRKPRPKEAFNPYDQWNVCSWLVDQMRGMKPDRIKRRIPKSA